MAHRHSEHRAHGHTLCVHREKEETRYKMINIRAYCCIIGIEIERGGEGEREENRKSGKFMRRREEKFRRLTRDDYGPPPARRE